jgi:hypothetical protein
MSFLEEDVNQSKIAYACIAVIIYQDIALLLGEHISVGIYLTHRLEISVNYYGSIIMKILDSGHNPSPLSASISNKAFSLVRCTPTRRSL